MERLTNTVAGAGGATGLLGMVTDSPVVSWVGAVLALASMGTTWWLNERRKLREAARLELLRECPFLREDGSAYCRAQAGEPMPPHTMN